MGFGKGKIYIFYKSTFQNPSKMVRFIYPVKEKLKKFDAGQSFSNGFQFIMSSSSEGSEEI